MAVNIMKPLSAWANRLPDFVKYDNYEQPMAHQV